MKVGFGKFKKRLTKNDHNEFKDKSENKDDEIDSKEELKTDNKLRESINEAPESDENSNNDP